MNLDSCLNEILSNLNNNNNNCLKIIEDNKIIKDCIAESENNEKINYFLEKLTEIILQNKKCNLKLVEKVLQHSLFKNVLFEFRNSKILIEACQNENKKVIKWLLKFNINQFVRDSQGRTALMISSKNPKLNFAIKHLLKQNDQNINLEDNKGNTALFYALHNPKILTLFLRHPKVNNHHINHSEDNILIYCCRNNLSKSIPIIMTEISINVNSINKEGRSAIMYIIENGMHEVLYNFVGLGVDCNYINEKNGTKENLYSIIINKIYYPTEHFEVPYCLHRYLKTFKYVVKLGCNPNLPIDDDGNTPLFFFAMIQDEFCVTYILKKYAQHTIDFNKVNKQGDDIISLCVTLNNDYLMKYIFKQIKKKKEDFKFKPLNDCDKNTILIYYTLTNNLNMIKYVLDMDESLLNQLNIRNENALIVATKLGYGKIVRYLLQYNQGKNQRSSIEYKMINQKDYLGNTALYYAIDIKNIFLINELSSYNASPNIINNRGKCARDLACIFKKVGDTSIIDALMHPIRMENVPEVKLKYKSENKIFISSLLTFINPLNYYKYKKISKNEKMEKCIFTSNTESLKYKGITEQSLNINNKRRYSPLPNKDIVRVIDWGVFERNYVEENFGKDNENDVTIKSFIKEFNNVILKTNKNRRNFRIFERVLKHNLFTEVLSEFRNSTIFVNACKKKRVNLIKWLLKMGINQEVQDNYNRTALMFLSKVPILIFAVKKILRKNKNCIELTDNLGRTALFYAANNREATYELIKAGANLNHKDIQGNNIFNYCCKNEFYYNLIQLIYNRKCDLNSKNNEGKGALSYLSENNNYWVIKQLTKKLNTRDKKVVFDNSQEVISILIKQIYQPDKKRHPNVYIPYYKTLKTLIDCKYNFNIVIDDEGNTPLMFFIMIEDFCTVYYLITHCKNLNLSLKNNNGDDAFSLSLKLNNNYLSKFIFKQKSLNFNYNDQWNNNILVFYIIANDNKMIRKTLFRNISLLNQVNIKKESPLIIATKLGRIEIVKTLLRLGADVDHQDNLGNTALYYAVDLKNIHSISILTFYKANLYKKNNRNVSPWDMIQQFPDKQKILDSISNAPSYFSLYPKKKHIISSNSLSNLIHEKRTKHNKKEKKNKTYYNNISEIKYQSTIEFEMNINQKYKPLQNSDVIRKILHFFVMEKVEKKTFY
ncbi:ankyrin [Piromyces finnis]|uniref:Ankyrin n=1 Tax=Piromyces finnis TaxID=1754191 RepID=A0A1Y1V238_9FUNG|nr:ankyrin [Piromyces finnis]|eukprot:ORX44868.1 ankyrin [Piromyces finnis]